MVPGRWTIRFCHPGRLHTHMHQCSPGGIPMQLLVNILVQAIETGYVAHSTFFEFTLVIDLEIGAISEP